eukprot:Lithocolla_globosa_v1_NODE_2036_length_2198_cov_11.412506.p2 type:complete len:128 gc:universal NODE_2036_length_2198_cov_11.412506:1364-1747(+)
MAYDLLKWQETTLRYCVNTMPSATPRHARWRALRLLRACLREAELATIKFALPYSPALVRAKITDKFRVNKSVSDPRAIDTLLIKAEMELDEARNIFKSDHHVRDFMIAPTREYQQPFLTRFYKNEL